jgi:hypothetical protein
MATQRVSGLESAPLMVLLWTLGCSPSDGGGFHRDEAGGVDSGGGASGASSGSGGAAPSGGAGGTGASGASGGTSAGGSGGVPNGELLARKRRIAVTDDRTACAISEARTVICWSGGLNSPQPREDGFDALAARRGDVCARKLDGSVTCWGGLTHSPAGAYADFSVGPGYACALQSSNGIPECWSEFAEGVPPGVPPEAFVEIEAAPGNACARRASGTIACWGDNADGLATPPAGSFSQVALGSTFGCALDAAGTAHCWGETYWRDPPEGKTLIQIAVGARASCGVLPNRSIECWSDASDFREVPPGRFVEVAVGRYNACAVREDASVVCWPPSLWDPPADLKVLLD